ncbi:MAG: hypothetical protein ACFCUS_14455 [Rubrimonas sp.]
MSLLLMRAGVLAQRAPAAPPAETGEPRLLDATRRPAGYGLSDVDRTAINVSGGADYRRWVPTARAILPTDGRRYWEVLCAPGGAAVFDGYLGVVSAAQREQYDAGENPVALGSIGYRGTGALWSSDTSTTAQRLTDLAPYGAGDVVMFQLDPAAASLWVGRNGIWRDDPVAGPPTWTAARSSAFHPQIHGRNPGDGGTLRSLGTDFAYAVPSGAKPLGFDEPDLTVAAAAAWIEIGGVRALSLDRADLWIEHGGGRSLGAASASLYIERQS